MAEGNILSVNFDISKLKVPDLKKELKSRGLSTTGNKNELMERLQGALKLNESCAMDSVEDLDEDLLNDDDDEHLDTSESVISDLVNALDDSTPQKTLKRKLSDLDGTESEMENKECDSSSKKIVLNRNHPKVSSTQRSSTESLDNEDTQKEERKVIKFSELTAKERLEMRAKKFGVPLSEQARKVARLERFSGTGNTTVKDKESSVDVLKQRAERFGCSTSTKLSALEKQERLEQRKARFGLMDNSNGNTRQVIK